MPQILDRLMALVAFILVSPILLIAFLGLKISSPGPFLYKAKRMGKDREPFLMYKIRTMHVASADKARQKITATQDPRIFPFGKILRLLKIDELPQLLNIIKGHMSFVGPRPEDEEIVSKHYNGWHFETLFVRPGLSSPGSLFNYTHFHIYVRDSHAEEDYIDNFLDRKLALDAVYARHKSFFYDVRVILRTIFIILQVAMGKRSFDTPPESIEAQRIFHVDYETSIRTH